jgi:hypothetical protein
MMAERLAPENIEESIAFGKFVIWSGNSLKEFDFCDRLFSNHSKPTEKDWDINDVSHFNYIYHRYNLMFKDKFIAFIINTPTFKNEILNTLLKEYKNNFKSETINLKYFDIMAFIAGNSFISQNKDINDYLISPRDKQETLFKSALSLYISNKYKVSKKEDQ